MNRIVIILICILFSCSDTNIEKEQKMINTWLSLGFSHQEINSKLDDYYYKEAKNYSNKGDYRLAIESYTSCIRVNSTDPYSYHSRGFVYHQLQEYELAIEDFKRALSLTKDNGMIQSLNFNIGTSYGELEYYSESILYLDKALSLNRFDPEALYHRGLAKKQLNLEFCEDFMRACFSSHEVACDKYEFYCE